MLDQCKHLLLSILILVALPGQAHAHTPRHIADSVAPKELVQLRVDAHVLRQHDLGGKLPHHSHSSRCSLLEGDLLHVLVKMNGAISGHRLLARTGSLLLFLHHDHTSQSKHDEVWAKMASRKVACFFSLRIWKEIIRRYHRSGKLCEVYLDLFLYMFEGGAVLDQSSCKKCVVQITHHDTNSIQKNVQPIRVTFHHLKDWLIDYKFT